FALLDARFDAGGDVLGRGGQSEIVNAALPRDPCIDRRVNWL
ncbi:MAG: hypothetical protein ACI9BO_001944, partial [Zhongshania sp.]